MLSSQPIRSIIEANCDLIFPRLPSVPRFPAFVTDSMSLLRALPSCCQSDQPLYNSPHKIPLHLVLSFLGAFCLFPLLSFCLFSESIHKLRDKLSSSGQLSHIFFTISLMSFASRRLSTGPAKDSPAESGKTVFNHRLFYIQPGNEYARNYIGDLDLRSP